MQSISAPAMTAAVSMRNIRVQFGSVIANDAVDFDVQPGEIHALLGENGAGKTTLMRVLAGLLQPRAGEIAINGKPAVLKSAQSASALGIGMVHQHFMLVQTLTVAENICLGLPSLRRWFPRIDLVEAEVSALGKSLGLEVEPRALAGELSIAGQQRVEILKALYRGAKILVLDEPTAVLTPREADRLFAVLKALAAKGTAIVFISHKLGEVMALTDRITVLRHGRVAGTLWTDQTSQRQVATLMVGGNVGLPHLGAPPQASGAKLLEARELSVRDGRGLMRLDKVSLDIHAGEILGVAGVDGNGQQELAEAIVGLRPIETGSLLIGGIEMANRPIAARLAAGLAHIPEDRHRTAIFEDMSITDNAVVEIAAAKGLSRYGFIDGPRAEAMTDRLVADYDVRCAGPWQKIGLLSGGNQQKVVLGRAMLRDPKVIIAVQPTRGLDIGASSFLQRTLLERRAQGAAVLLISMELDELQALSDRIIVLFKGAIIGVLSRGQITTERLGLLMAGEKL
ncbi:MAG TPA: ABC transporter ATP-binding protein [Arsenicitalea sp.]|nr:ABC transporter ATP-binding protein [Arsenicitalea sp.]